MRTDFPLSRLAAVSNQSSAVKAASRLIMAGIFATLLGGSYMAHAQLHDNFVTEVSTIKEGGALSVRENIIARVGALAFKGDQEALALVLGAGLDAGVPLAALREELVQLYAYGGFPKSLNALTTLFKLAQERGLDVKSDEALSAVILPQSLKDGSANQEKLIGNKVEGGIYDFAPAIDAYLKAHLFGDIFSRGELSWQEREIATIAMLSVDPNLAPQFNGHIAIGKHNGLTDAQVDEIKAISAEFAAGFHNVSAFPLGNENTAYAQYFINTSYLAPLTSNAELKTGIANVTFEPGCRNNWHKHTAGQILIGVGGVGYYQERGKAAVRILPGQVVEIGPDVEHWHGAAPDSWFSHLALEGRAVEDNVNTWLEPVDDESYLKAVQGE